MFINAWSDWYITLYVWLDFKRNTVSTKISAYFINYILTYLFWGGCYEVPWSCTSWEVLMKIEHFQLNSWLYINTVAYVFMIIIFLTRWISIKHWNKLNEIKQKQKLALKTINDPTKAIYRWIITWYIYLKIINHCLQFTVNNIILGTYCS